MRYFKSHTKGKGGEGDFRPWKGKLKRRIKRSNRIILSLELKGKSREEIKLELGNYFRSMRSRGFKDKETWLILEEEVKRINEEKQNLRP